MTARANAQPSGGDGAMAKAREYLSDPDFIERAMYLAKRHEPAYRPALGFAVCALCDQTYPCMPAVMLAEVERLQARLAAVERERDALRQQVAMLGDARAVAGQQRAILDEFGVVHARHDHFLLAQEVMRLRYAATHPDTGGDHA